MSGLQDNSNASEDVLINNLANAIPLLVEADIVGLIEPINSYSVPNYFLNTFELGEY
jgi:hydroxypyruvate isomerase